LLIFASYDTESHTSLPSPVKLGSQKLEQFSKGPPLLLSLVLIFSLLGYPLLLWTFWLASHGFIFYFLFISPHWAASRLDRKIGSGQSLALSL